MADAGFASESLSQERTLPWTIATRHSGDAGFYATDAIIVFWGVDERIQIIMNELLRISDQPSTDGASFEQ